MCYTIPRFLAPLTHPDTEVRCAAMTIRPYKPSESARSVLLTAVHDQLPGLAVHPQGYTTLRHLTGAADTCGARVDVRKSWMDFDKESPRVEGL